jgi:hypothetical protein
MALGPFNGSVRNGTFFGPRRWPHSPKPNTLSDSTKCETVVLTAARTVERSADVDGGQECRSRELISIDIFLFFFRFPPRPS